MAEKYSNGSRLRANNCIAASPYITGSLMTKFVFLVQVPFTYRDYQRNGIEFLARRGIDVTVLDVSRIAMPRLVTKPEQLEFPGMDLIVANGLHDLDRCRPILDTAALIVSHVGSGFLTWDNLPVIRAVSRSGRPSLMLNANAIPSWQAATNILGHGGVLKNLLVRLRLLNPSVTFLNRLPLKLFGVRPYDYVVYGGLKSISRRRLVTSATRPIYAHSMDYDLYLNERDAPQEEPAQPFAVFLDQYVGFHPDIAMGGVSQADEPERFYPPLRRMMDRIESELGLKTVIAAHPRADYSDKPGLFGDRPIIYGQTPRLVHQSRLVVTAYSVAVGLAVMFDKPLCLIATQGLLDHPSDGWVVRRLCQELGITALRIDKDYTLDHIRKHKHDRYRDYLNNYIKVAGTPDRELWEIVLDSLGSCAAAPLRKATAC